jgi:hypothetical protein
MEKISFYITPHFSFGYFSRSERLYFLFCHRRNFLSVGLPQSAAGRHWEILCAQVLLHVLIFFSIRCVDWPIGEVLLKECPAAFLHRFYFLTLDEGSVPVPCF